MGGLFVMTGLLFASPGKVLASISALLVNPSPSESSASIEAKLRLLLLQALA
jgi:hypothetical protein